MKAHRILVALTLLLAGGCMAPVRDSTVVTFAFETWDTQFRLIGGYPVEARFDIPGFAPFDAAGKTTLNYQVLSAKYPKSAEQINAQATVQAPPGTLLTCSWTAATPAGKRISDRSRGGEGSAAVPMDGTSATVSCQYQA